VHTLRAPEVNHTPARAFPKSLGKPRICHPERSEGSLLHNNEILHFVQNDNGKALTPASLFDRVRRMG